jgi:hypothetical protein
MDIVKKRESGYPVCRWGDFDEVMSLYGEMTLCELSQLMRWLSVVMGCMSCGAAAGKLSAVEYHNNSVSPRSKSLYLIAKRIEERVSAEEALAKAEELNKGDEE